MRELAGKIGVVTGGAGGIGRCIGERFAREGLRVVLADIDEATLAATVAELRDRGLDVIGVVTDVSDRHSVEALRDATLSAYGKVHVVCNNAGVASGAVGHLWEHEDNDWRWALGVHLFGVIHGINAFVPALIEQGEEAHVVNTSSNNGGISPIATSPIYAVCKSAIVTLSECLWAQLRMVDAKVSVSVLFPSGRTQGILRTGIWVSRNRPPELAPERPREDRTQQTMEEYAAAMEAAGMTVAFTPLEEVADQVIEGLLADQFWMLDRRESFDQAVRARAQAILDRADPAYLLERPGTVTATAKDGPPSPD